MAAWIAFGGRPKNNFRLTRPDLGQIWPIRLNKTAGIAKLFREIFDWRTVKDGPKVVCEIESYFFSAFSPDY